MSQNDLLMPFDRAEILNALRENRKKHANEYREAHEGWVEEVKERLHAQLEAIHRGERPLLSFHDLNEPDDHTEDYDLAIQMLEMTKAEQVSLTRQDFRQYVQNKWSWAEMWSASNVRYIEKHRMTLRRH